jgi:DNA-binding NarL/FixJ family response regulator
VSDLTLMLVGFGRLFEECLVQAAPDLRVMPAVDAEADVRRRIAEERPDVVAVDVGASNGNGRMLELVRTISQTAPQTKVIAYGLDPAQDSVLRWIEAGAHGYLPRDASLSELRRTVSLVAAGQMPTSPEMAFALFSRLAELARARRRTNVLESLVLTSRELDVLRLISAGLSNRDMAERMSLSFHTVKNHVQNIFKKLDVTRRIEAVEHARRQGWLDE